MIKMRRTHVLSVAAASLLAVFVADASAIGRYEVLELTYAYPTAGLSNPMWDVTVQSTFTAPSGKKLLFEGFYYDVNTYKVRFSPAEVGTYQYDVSLQGPSGPAQVFNGSFVVTPSASKGFIRRLPGSSYKLKFEDGSVFNGLGFNTCLGNPTSTATWGHSIGGAAYEPPGEGGVVPLNDFFQKFNVDGGFNLFRWNNGNCSFYFDTGSPGIAASTGRNADHLLSTAKANGFHVWYCFFPAGGAYLNAHADPAEGLKFQKYVRYIFARLGAYVDVWEWMNESCNPGDAGCGTTATDAWLIYASNFLRGMDPYQRLITNSYPRPNDAQSLDAQSTHPYGFWRPPDDFYNLTNKNGGMPHLAGEGGTGLSGAWNITSARDMRMFQWAAVFGGAGVAWWNQNASTSAGGGAGNLYMGSLERKYTRVLQNFFTGVEADFQPSKPVPSNNRTVVYSLITPSQADAYVYRTSAGGVSNTGTVTTSFVLNLPYNGTAQWIDPATGNTLQTVGVSAGNITLVTPAFADDVAVKIIPGATAPGLTPPYAPRNLRSR